MITPTLVQALQGKKVKSAVGGEGHSGALLLDGRLYTWGANDMGVLGHGRGSTQQWLPRMVRYTKNFVCGTHHITPFIHPLYNLYTPFVAVHAPTYTRYTCICNHTYT